MNQKQTEIVCFIQGLQASQDIADGQPFIEFKGKVMLKKEFDEFTKPSNR